MTNEYFFKLKTPASYHISWIIRVRMCRLRYNQSLWRTFWRACAHTINVFMDFMEKFLWISGEIKNFGVIHKPRHKTFQKLILFQIYLTKEQFKSWYADNFASKFLINQCGGQQFFLQYAALIADFDCGYSTGAKLIAFVEQILFM